MDGREGAFELPCCCIKSLEDKDDDDVDEPEVIEVKMDEDIVEDCCLFTLLLVLVLVLVVVVVVLVKVIVLLE